MFHHFISHLKLQREQDNVLPGGGERSRGQIMVATAKGAGTTNSLEVESSGKRSDHGCDCKGSWDDILPGGGEGGPRGQITVATAKGAGATYDLEVERGGKRSDHGCDCRGSRDDIQPGGGEQGARGQIMIVTAEGVGTMTYSLEVEGGQEVRSQL